MGADDGSIIYIQPFDQIDEDILLYIECFLSDDSQMPVKILPSIPIPDDARGRPNQLDAEILRSVKLNDYKIPKDAFRIIDLTDEDIYKKSMNYIFGCAKGGKDCLVSLHRLRPTGNNGEYINKLDSDSANLFQTRIRKILRHELGHTFGLPHCDNINCVMYYANSLNEADKSGEYFCSECARVLLCRKKYLKQQGK